jgi:hypothetical protein
MPLVHHALAGKRRGDQGSRPRHQLRQQVRRPGRAQTDVEQRAPRLTEHLRNRLDLLGIWQDRLGPGRQQRPDRLGVILLGQEVQVRGDLHGHWTWTSTEREVHGLEQHRHDLLAARGPEGALGDGTQQGQLIDIVELVAERHVVAHPTGQHQQRHAVHERLRDAGQGVGHTRTGHDVGTGDATPRSRETVAQKARALLVGDQDRAHLTAGQRVVQLDVVRTRNTKSMRDASGMQRRRDQLAAWMDTRGQRFGTEILRAGAVSGHGNLLNFGPGEPGQLG